VALNEWGFAAEVKSWWDTALAADASELDHCSVEEQVEVGGSQKRSDLTVLTATGEVRLAGELRLPDHREHDPWDPNNLLGRFRSRRSHARATKATAVRGVRTIANRSHLVTRRFAAPCSARSVRLL